MRPILIQIGPIPVYSYGLMVAIAFLVADYLLGKEFRRLKMNVNYANEMVVLALVFGIVGAKFLYLIENFSDFLSAPLEMIFSAGGLTWYGGFILAFIALFLYVKRKKLSVLNILDAVAPATAIGYGIGRIGCHLAGDGDYGIPTSLPWGTIYANGVLKPSYALRHYFEGFPELAEKYNYWQLSSQIVSEDKFGLITKFDLQIRLHPTPVYEFIIMFLIFLFLWGYRKKIKYPGQLFSLYLILSSIERFSIEFIRLNPPLIFGLTEAQLISILLLLIGIFLFQRFKPKKEAKENNKLKK